MKKIYFLLGFLLILVLFLFWYFFLYYPVCDNENCFFDKMATCSKVRYTSNHSWAYFYEIEGERKDACLIKVKLVFAGGEEKFSKLIGKRMNCYLPLRYIDLPENNLEFCNGPLKEEIQYFLIKDSITYINQNLGK